MPLPCELPGIGRPKAATFWFCTSLLAFNLRQTIFGELYVIHDAEVESETSHFHITKYISDKIEGMLIAITEEEWNHLIPSTTCELASQRKKIASTIELGEYRKGRRGPKKKKPHRSRKAASSRASTAKLLDLT